MNNNTFVIALFIAFVAIVLLTSLQTTSNTKAQTDTIPAALTLIPTATSTPFPTLPPQHSRVNGGREDD